MHLDWIAAGLAGLFLGSMIRTRSRPAADEKLVRLERRIDALMEHHRMKPEACLPEEVERLARSGRMMEAIKAYREAKGVGLKEAHDAVLGLNRLQHKLDGLLAHLGIRLDDRLPDEVARLAMAGKKFEAVKALRRETGMSLGEAKQALEGSG
jgi:ribosomal protein L7/L12